MHPDTRNIVRRRLLAWYRRWARDLPWRRNPTLYRVLVAEFMFQQTRTEQALPYYRRFLRRFPSMRRLASAELSQVLKVWEGLGYYRRAAMLHETAGLLSKRSRPTLDEVRNAPGIGSYTFAAIASIVYGEPIPVVDGNVRRVLSRCLAMPEVPSSAQGDRRIRDILSHWISPRSPGDWNQAIMEVGATVCRPRDPRCAACPLSGLCRAHKSGNPTAFPAKKPTRPHPHHHIAACVIRRADGRILIAQRLPDGLLPNLWEFPGGKRERGESLQDCCRREIREELGVQIAVGRQLARVEHTYSHYSVTIHFFDCTYLGGRPRTLDCQDFRWVRPRDLPAFAFPRANWSIVRWLARRARAAR